MSAVSLGFLSLDAPVPENAVYIQALLNPSDIRAKWKLQIPAVDAWTVPPCHLVFAQTAEQPQKDAKRRRLNNNNSVAIGRTDGSVRSASAHDRYPVVLNAMSNMIGCSDEDTLRLRCIGVCVDGVPYSRDLRQFPNACARFSVAIAGVVTIACDRNDLRDADVGDTLYWTLDEADIAFEGFPNHRSVRLFTEKTAPDNTADAWFRDGSTGDYTLTREEWLKGRRVIGTLLAFSEFHDECRVLLRI